MIFEIGKVIEYNNKEGKILTSNKKIFLFLEKDLDTEVKLNDLVIFRPEKYDDVNRAYFVKNLKLYMTKDTNRNHIKKYLRSKNYEV